MNWLLIVLALVDGQVVMREEHVMPDYTTCRDSAYTARGSEVSSFCVPSAAPPAPALAGLTDCRRVDVDGDGVVGLEDQSALQALTLSLMGTVCATADGGG
jgi:hypothetical protein